MDWPQTIYIGPIRMTVNSWSDVREALQELGPSVVLGNSEQAISPPPTAARVGDVSDGMTHGDRTLLSQFIEAHDRGLLTSQVGQALGKRGKGIRPALERWSRKIKLVEGEDATAFESIKRFDGRGFRMTDHYRRVAAAMTGHS